MSDPVLEARGVSVEFPASAGFLRPSRSVAILQDVSIAVGKGEVLAIVGESGSGKTTLAKLLLGVLKPSAGEIRIEGRPIAGLSRLDLARRIQAIFQDPFASLNPRKTIRSIVSLPLRVLAIGSSVEREEKVRRIMDVCGLPASFADRYPGELSGGQRQRVAIARALVSNPGIVICDEPTSALDVSIQAQILNLLVDLREQLGLTYVFISHNLAVVEHLATKVAVMYLGRIVELADTASLFAGPRHPYTQALLAAMLPPKVARHLPPAIAGDFPSIFAPPSGCAFHPRCAQAMPVCGIAAPPMIENDGGDVRCHLYDPALTEGGAADTLLNTARRSVS